MIHSRVVWTVLPNYGDKSSIWVTLHASMVIQPPGSLDEIALENLPPFDNWPEAIRSITSCGLEFIGANGSTEVAIDDCETTFTVNEASEIWRKMFPGHTMVERYYNPINKQYARSYGVHSIENILRKLYVRAAELDPEKYPDKDIWKSIINVLTPQDRLEFEHMQRFFDDMHEPLASSIPDRRNKPDFNVILSSLSAYPVLQRKIGLSIDVRINTLDGIQNNGTVRLIGRVPPHDLTFRVFRPSTEYIMKDSDPRFFQVPEVPDTINKRTLNGLLPIGERRYTVSSINVESPSAFFHGVLENRCDLRLMIASSSNPEDEIIREFEVEFESKKDQCAVLIVRATSDSDKWTIAGFNDAGEFRTEIIDDPSHELWKELKKEPHEESRIIKLALSSLGRTRENSTEVEEYRLPALTSEGISVLDTGGIEHLEHKLDRASGLEDEVVKQEPELKFDLNDITEGLRVDIYDIKASVWRSLCKRVGEYHLGSRPPIIIKSTTDEGMVTRAAIEPLNEVKDFFISPALFEWNGWSLCVDLPESPADESSGSCKINVTFGVPSRSLPRLRFGAYYSIRARTVDLAGNSVPMVTADQVVDKTNTIETQYLRADPINSPQLIPAEPLQKDRNDSEDVFVLRSNYDMPADQYMDLHNYSIPLRHIAPPEVEQKFAEKHGVFDKENGLDPEAYETIRKFENEFPDSIGEKAIEIPYLSDPLSKRFQLRVLGHRIVEAYPSEKGWPHIRTCLFRLKEGPTGFGSNETEFTLSLEKAEVTDLQISSGLAVDVNPQHLLLHAHWASFLSSSRIKDGDYWLTTPYRTIKLVHAVQQPLCNPLLSLSEVTNSVGVLYSNRGDTEILLKGSLQYHGKSTSSVDIIGQRTEWKDDPAAGPPSIVSNDDNILSEVVQVTENFIQFDESTQFLLHDFSDTKHHLVKYSAVATSRFQEYFPQNESLDFTRISNEADISAHSTVRRLSTARPPKPEVAYVIPAFRFSIENRQDTVESLREAQVLRVYLQRPWFETGDCERLGLAMSTGDLDSVTDCEWGVDPIHESHGNLRSLSINNLNSPLCIVQDKLPGSERKIDIALYKVKFDRDVGLWYADVRFVDVPAYMPFVRLSLLRYQPWSLDGLHASEPAPIEYIQMLNDRKCVISETENDGNRVTFNVNIRGVELKTILAFFQARNLDGLEMEWESVSKHIELQANGSGEKSATIFVNVQPARLYRLVVFESEQSDVDPSSVAFRQTYLDHFDLGELASNKTHKNLNPLYKQK